ncbi:MAG: hypothetical protein KJ767_02860 [Nanoarchaeota archaeon]|nr:hypothetical protein [Nanoarchaeota archaeon]
MKEQEQQEKLERLNELYWTPQEHGLFGSTVEENYNENPYTPLAIQDKKISVKECNDERYRLRNIICAGIYDKKLGDIVFEFSSLDTNKDSEKYAQTISDPKLVSFKACDVDSKLITNEDLDAKLLSNPKIPFKRE